MSHPKHQSESRTNPSPAPLLTDMANIPISTPSSGMPLNFESLMNGGTGLTPQGPLAPTCSSQQRNGDLPTPENGTNKRMLSLWQEECYWGGIVVFFWERGDWRECLVQYILTDNTACWYTRRDHRAKNSCASILYTPACNYLRHMITRHSLNSHLSQRTTNQFHPESPTLCNHLIFQYWTQRVTNYNCFCVLEILKTSSPPLFFSSLRTSALFSLPSRPPNLKLGGWNS